MSTIQIKNLHFSYAEGKEVLKGMSFEIDERSTAIIGQNGAGKRPSRSC
jgi:energy-coupling factor transport system ATP-binding protein